MIPGVTGLGMLSKADEAYDGYRLLNNVDNISDSRYAINYTDNWIDDAACFNSFSADTTVVTDKGDVPISQIQIGDFVLAWNEETNEITFELVTDTIHHTDEVVVYLTIDGEEIETTPEHPFYVEGAGWTDAEDLQLGDEIRNADGEAGKIESITIKEVTQEMYNLTVDEAHTFFVGDGQWLVHNTNCLFRGTSLGYPGNPSLQRQGVTPTSTDPIVATIFGTESGNYGYAVLHIANLEIDLAGVPFAKGNVFKKIEREIVLAIPPFDFASRASITISAEDSRKVLRTLRVNVPSRIQRSDIKDIIEELGYLNSDQINQYLNMISLIGK